MAVCVCVFEIEGVKVCEGESVSVCVFVREKLR